jgi:hypothetical protein
MLTADAFTRPAISNQHPARKLVACTRRALWAWIEVKWLNADCLTLLQNQQSAISIQLANSSPAPEELCGRART